MQHLIFLFLPTFLSHAVVPFWENRKSNFILSEVTGLILYNQVKNDFCIAKRCKQRKQEYAT